MPATWPVSLPQLPLAEGYEERPGPNVLASPMEIGEKRRLRFTKTHDPHAMIFELDATQFTTFKMFFNTTLKKGSLPFEYTHPTEAVTATWVFRGEPQYSCVGGPIYQAVCQLVRTG